MLKNAGCSAIVGFLFAFTIPPVLEAQAQQVIEHVIIATPKPYTDVVSKIRKLGGNVKQQFQYIDAISADIPSGVMPAVRDLVGDDAVARDSIIRAPRRILGVRKNVSKAADSDIYTSIPVGTALGPVFPVKPPATAPSEKAYAVNNANVKLRDLHAAGYTGKNIVVAVIDSGIRPGYASLDSDGSVIGGDDFVGDGNSFISPSNDPHGTFVSALISGNARFPVPGTSASSVFIKSMNSNFAGTLESTAGGTVVNVIGSAPEAKIYVVRVFGVGAGAPKSRVIAAIERVIQLRENFDKYGQYSAANPRGGFNIKVCNMSLGTSTVNAGHTELEQLLDTMVAKDIVPVVSAGDAGPSSLTISSPATSFSALTVGATSPAANERLENDLLNNNVSQTPAFGIAERPTTYTQTAWFSSRGPTADGRVLPDVVAAGVGMLSQGCGGLDNAGNCANIVNNLDVADGTSFSASVVSGIAAVLRQKFPSASAGQIWNAIVNSADDQQLGDHSTVLDQGEGVVNASMAANLIQAGKVSDKLPKPDNSPDSLVSNNIQRGTDLNVDHGTVREQFKNLKPGERREILYQVDPTTSQVVINLTNIKLAPNQNILFGDDVFVHVHSAKTSAGVAGDYFFNFFPLIVSDTSIVINDPEPGIMRITLMGDFTNAGNVSADVGVASSKDPLPKKTVEGKIRGGDNLFFPIDVPAGVSTAQFDLRWNQDWGHYPTNDLDMYLYDPKGGINGSGATLDCPEDVVIKNPTPGRWFVLVQGFSVATKNDQFVLSVLLDGKPVKIDRDGDQE